VDYTRANSKNYNTSQQRARAAGPARSSRRHFPNTTKEMAAPVEASASSADVVQLPDGHVVVIKTEPEGEEDEVTRPQFGAVLKREPVISLMSPLSGTQLVTWSQDHRLAVSTTSAVSLVELVCDVRNNTQGMSVYRTSIPVRRDVLKLKVHPLVN